MHKQRLWFVPRVNDAQSYVFRYVVTLATNYVRTTAPASGPPHLLKGVLRNQWVGRVLGPKHSILNGIKKSTSSEIDFTEFGDYHPSVFSQSQT
jgi:hypothetical protein